MSEAGFMQWDLAIEKKVKLDVGFGM